MTGGNRGQRVTKVIFCSIFYLYHVDAFVSFLGFRNPHPPKCKWMATSDDISTLEKKTVVELKAELRVRGLTVSGPKSKLIERLVEDFEKEQVSDKDGYVIEDSEEGPANTETTEALETNDQGFIIDDDLTETAQTDKQSRKPPVTSATALAMLPVPLLKALTQRMHDNPTLLPIQERAFKPIASGSDAVLFAPTGSGKTLGYTLPLLARLLKWKQMGTLKKRRRLSQEEYYSSREPSCPSILILTPSRELTKQVGKVMSQFHPTSSGRVAAVFGGVPLERHASLLRRELDVIVGTPGRIRELIREGHLSTEQVKSIVLDEADVLLDFDDQPEIEMLLDGMLEDYQLVLASATVNRRVKEFVSEVMEIDESSNAFVVVGGPGIDNQKVSSQSSRPTVRHWSTAARASARSGLAADIIATVSPRIGIVFVASKVEADLVSEELSERLPDVRVSVLHGDMSQSARSRTVAALRDESRGRNKIMVATDVASRGLDLPGVDLVLQFGIPRQSGRDGTYDSELYRHRAGRAGRIGGGSKAADAILLYDPAEGEGKVLPELVEELKTVGVQIQPRSLPSPNDVMEASYARAKRSCDDMAGDTDFVHYFKQRILAEWNSSDKDVELVDRLAAAMAALSGLNGAVSQRSLLTADTRDRTVRVWSSEATSLRPPEVTRFAKSLGSGKLGRVTICNDGSAVFDLPVKRAERLLNAYGELNKEERSLHIEIPTKLPP